MSHELLTEEDEISLARKIAQGEDVIAARNAFVDHNYGLVLKVCGEFLGRGLSQEDLFQEGCIGLMKAAEEFDPKFRVRFSTYAVYWIRQSMRIAIINTGHLIRLPAHMNNLISAWRKIEVKMVKRGLRPSQDDIARSLQLSHRRLKLMQQAMKSIRVKPLGADSTIKVMTSSCEEDLMKIDEAEWVRKIMMSLREDELTVLNLRHGLTGQDPMTLREVGRVIGCTKEWVRQIELRGSRHLRELIA